MTERTEKKENQGWGGARPNSGRPSEFEDRTRITFYMEAADKKRLNRLAERVNDVILKSNLSVPPEDRDDKASSSEIVRFGVRVMIDHLGAQSPENVARRYRPYLGRQKPSFDLDDEDEEGMFQDRVRYSTYLERKEKQDLESLAEAANVVIRRANSNQTFKKDRDTLMSWSEIARDSAGYMLNTYYREPVVLAELLRPMLGRAKP